MNTLTTIISGGQTGVDQAALRAGRDSNLAIGGWCPPGRTCETGIIPIEYPLRETPKDRSQDAPDLPRSQRTEWNVRDSDATLILLPPALWQDHDLGTSWTAQCAARYGRPLLICEVMDQSSITRITLWLDALKIRTLNVAGPSESHAPGIGAGAYDLLFAVLSDCKRRDHISTPQGTPSSAGSPDRPSHPTGPLPWWIGIPWSLLKRGLAGANSLRLIVSTIVAILLLVASLFFAVRVFDLRIVAGKVYLGSAEPSFGAHLTVDATAGFQDSGIKLGKGDRLILHPEGRIHTAMDHAANLARAVKGVIVHRTPNRIFPDYLLKRYPLPPLDDSSVFYRDWCGPEGEAVPSDMLEDCKFRKDLNWGALLAIVLPTQVSARSDPYEVLKNCNLTSLNLLPVPSETRFVADRDGWLTFIINEAIISPLSPSADSQAFYSALKQTAESLTGDPRHRIPLQSIPLIWFADNNGAFRVTVSYQR
jgi:hypothetical protein